MGIYKYLNNNSSDNITFSTYAGSVTGNLQIYMPIQEPNYKKVVVQAQSYYSNAIIYNYPIAFTKTPGIFTGMAISSFTSSSVGNIYLNNATLNNGLNIIWNTTSMTIGNASSTSVGNSVIFEGY